MPRQQGMRNAYVFKETLIPRGIRNGHDNLMRVRPYSRGTRGMAEKVQQEGGVQGRVRAVVALTGRKLRFWWSAKGVRLCLGGAGWTGAGCAGHMCCGGTWR